jgi:hypothetical protein
MYLSGTTAAPLAVRSRSGSSYPYRSSVSTVEGTLEWAARAGPNLVHEAQALDVGALGLPYLTHDKGALDCSGGDVSGSSRMAAAW